MGSPGTLRLVAIKLPNMKLTGRESSVRNDLKATEGVTSIETDLDEQTCSFRVDASVDVRESLNGRMD